MNHFLTGRSGFISGHVIAYLKEQGHTIVDTMPEADVIVHLAAYGNHSHQNNIRDTVQANITDLYDLIKTARQIGRFQKFYNISTSSVTLKKQTPYSASKMMGETIVNSFGDERIVNVRPYSVYGPGEASHRFIPRIIECLHSGEEMELTIGAWHDWIFAPCFVKAMFSGYTHIGTGVMSNNKDVVGYLESISGKKLNYKLVNNLREYDTDKWVCPTGVPALSLYEGLKLTYDHFTNK
jgi:nucleoside-diphosphate-sugar epimerase